MKHRNIFALITLALSVLLFTVFPVYASVGNRNNVYDQYRYGRTATGRYTYTIGNVRRNAYLDIRQNNNTGRNSLNLSGSYVFSLSGTYNHDISIRQTGDDLIVTGGYPAGTSAYTYHETGRGKVNRINDTFTFTNKYRESNYTYTIYGRVNPDTGVLSVTGWSGGAGTDWTVTAGKASVVSNINGSGVFNYNDVNGTHYTVNVRYVSIEGRTAWFAGPVVTGNYGNGQWLFARIIDNGNPGAGRDITGGDFPLTETQARDDVTAHIAPSVQATITSGNIQVY